MGISGVIHRGLRCAAKALFLIFALSLLPGTASAQSARRLLREGVKLYNQGLYAEALGRFTSAYEKDRRLTRSLVYVGSCQLRLGDPEEGLTAFERFETEERRLGAAEQARLRAYYEEVAQKFIDDHRRDGRPPELLLLAGRALFRAARQGEAIPLYHRYQREVAKPPPRYAKLLSQYLLEYHRFALAAGLAAMAKPDWDRRVLLDIADAQRHLGKPVEALDAYDRFRQEVPTPKGPDATRLAEGYSGLVAAFDLAGGPSRFLVLGRAHFGVDQLPEASWHYRRYQEAVPAPPPEDKLRLRRYLEELATRERRALTEQRIARQLHLATPGAAPAKPPLHRRWWLWTAVGGGLAVGLTAGLAAGLARPGIDVPAGVEVHSIEPR